MNRRLLNIALSREYCKHAFRVSAIVHVIVLIVWAFLFFKAQQVQELEDEIQVGLIYELPRQHIVKKKVIPIPPQETEPITQVKRTLQKKVNVGHPEPSLEIAKMPSSAPAQVDIQSESKNKIDVDLPTVLDALDLSTDARLTPSPESVLSPISSDTGDTPGKSYGRREVTGVRSPGKGTGAGTGIAQKTLAKAAKGQGSGTAGIGDSNSQFSSIINNLADEIINASNGAPIDVVFVVDASGSMGDNINAVAEHLGQMIDAYKAAEIDYALGLTQFSTSPINNNIKNYIRVFPLMTSLSQYKQALYAIIPVGDENALDAIEQTVREMQFRTTSQRHFILVTDEPFTSIQGHTVDNTIARCRNNEIYVHVLGLNAPDHKRFATETQGKWHAIPEDKTPRNVAQPIPQSFRTAQWQDTQRIGKKILQDSANVPIDVILFIDGSKSMEDKIPHLSEQIGLWIRDWDNALINYRLGVVRFRASGTVNMVNVFKPPQTLEQIHAILQLPAQDDENLIYAVIEGTRRLKFRSNAITYLILITDEPGNPKTPFIGTISLLKEIPVVVSVIGTFDAFQKQVAVQTGGEWVVIPNGHTSSKTSQ